MATGRSAILLAVALALLLPGCGPRALDGGNVEDAPEYANQMRFSGLRLSAEENFLGQQVVYLDGKIANAGPRTVRQLKVRLFFRDYLNQVVLREEHEVVTGSKPLGPSQERDFQIRFDQIPDSWSQQVPEVQITTIRVQQP